VQAAYEHVVGQIQSFAQSAHVNFAVGGFAESPGSSTSNSWPFDVSNNGGRWDVLLALESIGQNGQPVIIPSNEWPPGPQFGAPGNWAELDIMVRYTRSADGGYLVSALDPNANPSDPSSYPPIIIAESTLQATLHDGGVSPGQTLQWNGQNFVVPQGAAIRQ